MRLLRSYLRQRYFGSNAAKQSNWNSVVGLEVHAQIDSQSKLFSGATHKFAGKINDHVSLFDAAIPGTLPVLNKRCVEAAAMAALALNCKVNPISAFDRKHYFYADLPAGYQITQQRLPLAVDGKLEFEVFNPAVNKKPYSAKARIKQIQLEQDSGKSLHDSDRSLVDLNRAGAPLIEIVFEPDLCNGEEAAALVKELVVILQRIGTSNARMEEGALRVDANVSLHKPGEPFGVRTEIKNIGSIGGIADAIAYEIQRQMDELERGNPIMNETRAWNVTHKMTVAMRDKEEVQDYRYMPEPNLPPLQIAVDRLQNGYVKLYELEERMPELPEATRARLKNEYKLSREQSIILVNHANLLRIFEGAIQKCNDYKLIANLIINDLLTLYNLDKNESTKITGGMIGGVAQLIVDGIINKNISKLLLEKLHHDDSVPIDKVIADNDWKQINDEVSIRSMCEQVLQNSENAKVVKDYKSGKDKAFKSLLGKVYDISHKRANMNKVSNVLKAMLSDDSKKTH